MALDTTDWNDEADAFTVLGMAFDIRAAKEILRSVRREVHSMRVADAANHVNRPGDGKIVFGGIFVDWAKVNREETDLSVPVILASLMGSYFPIDGWHRIAKAKELGLETLPCVVLDVHESERIRLPSGIRTRDLRPNRSTKIRKARLQWEFTPNSVRCRGCQTYPNLITLSCAAGSSGRKLPEAIVPGRLFTWRCISRGP